MRGCALLFLLVLLPGAMFAQVTARASLDSTDYLVGDPITVQLDLMHPKGTRLKLAVGDTLNGFQILDRAPFTLYGETTSSASLVAAKYDSGSAVLPPLEILYTLPGDTTLRRVTTNPLIVTIHTISVDTSQAYKDIKPLLSIPLTLAEVLLYSGIVLVVVLLAYLGYRYWKKKQQKVTGEVYVPPTRPAHAVALQELALLKEKKLWQKGLIKEYYSEASEIVRRYIENRFKLMALEQTTDEIMRGLKRFELKPAVTGKLETLLQLSDLVKFAKYQPGLSEHEEILGMAFEIVEATKPVEMKPAVQAERKVPANVES